MNPMFLSFLKSMQTKSQDAQNPGLWVNGMRQPIQENEKRAQKIIDWNHNGVISKAENELTDFAKGQIAAEDADRRGEHEAEMKAENGWRNSGGYRGSDEDGGRELNAINNEIDNGVLVGGEDFSQEPFNDTRRRAAQTAEDAFNNKMNPPDPREGMAPDSEDLHNPGKISSFMKKKPMQENTNRSMFLTHLQGMQTNSQDAQNPGLWVNGMRQPIQETSNQRRADYLLQVSGVKERTPGSPPRSMRKIVKTNSGRGANLAFQGEDGQGIPANLLGGPNMKNAIAKELGVPNGIVYPNNKYLKEKPTIDLNLDGQVSKAELDFPPKREELPDFDQLYPNRTQQDFINHITALNDRFNKR